VVSTRLPASPSERAGGLHLSDIIREISLQVGVLDQKYRDSEPDLFKMFLGLAFERAVLDMWGTEELDEHPGETQVGDIPMTPDAVGWIDSKDPQPRFFVEEHRRLRRRSRKQVLIPVVHEVKLTWKSSSRGALEEFMWMAQLKGYCYALDTRFGVLHVGWVNGDYKFDGTGGFYGVYQIEFTDLELKENWHMVERAFTYQSKSKGVGR
jgi:hypothetical protein